MPAAHEGWLLQTPDGKPKVWDTRDDWGGAVFILDGANVEVAAAGCRPREGRRGRPWGYDYLALDWLSLATVEARREATAHPGRAYPRRARGAPPRGG